jgi:hypothetical protein
VAGAHMLHAGQPVKPVPAAVAATASAQEQQQ